MEKEIEKFKEMVKEQSQYKKWYSRDTIEYMYSYFDIKLKKMKYGNTLDVDPLKLALSFYKEHFSEYYPLIEEGLKNNRIRIVDNESPHTTLDGISIIGRVDTDEFFYRIIHELGHYIDCNSNPRIISKEWHIYPEVTPFYVEKKFESVYKDKYPELIKVRINNRLNVERKMLKNIKRMLKYEDYYKEHGRIDDIIEENEVQQLMAYNSNNIVNFLLRYPVSNLLTTYMVINDIGLIPKLEEKLKDVSLIDLMKDEKLKKMLLNENKKRCKWVNIMNNNYLNYHDTEWGTPSHDDNYLFEMLLLESFQAGLSWECILNKRKYFRSSFDNFDYTIIAKYDDKKIEELMNNKDIVRNRLKIKAAINNAKVFMDIKHEYGSFDKYIWGFTNGEVIYGHGKNTTSPLSDKISADLIKRGMKFVGSTIIYSYLQAIGIINDHEDACFLN